MIDNRNKVIFFSIVCFLCFGFTSVIYYNYDFGEYNGYNYSHDRDRFTVQSKASIDLGYVTHNYFDTDAFPFTSDMWFENPEPYPRAFSTLVATLSLLVGIDVFLSMLIWGLQFFVLLILVSFIFGNSLFSNYKVGILAAAFSLLSPTTGSFHGPIVPLPSTISFVFLLCSLMIVLTRNSRYNNIFLIFLLGLLISLIHRPTMNFTFLFLFPFLSIAKYRLLIIFNLMGLYIGLALNRILLPEVGIEDLINIPDLTLVPYLILSVLAALAYTRIHKYLYINHNFPKIQSFSKHLLYLYTPVLVGLIAFIAVLALLSPKGIYEISDLYGLSFVMPLTIVGGLFVPVACFFIFSDRSDYSLLALLILPVGLVGLYLPLGILQGSQRLTIYAMGLLVLFQAKFFIKHFTRQNLYVSLIILIYITGMGLVNIIEAFGPFGLRNFESGISYQNSQEAVIYLDEFSPESEKPIVISDVLLASKIDSQTDINRLSVYREDWPGLDLLMARNIPDFVIIRNYEILNKDTVDFSNPDSVLESNLVPHKYSNENSYYLKVMQSNDITIYQKIQWG